MAYAFVATNDAFASASGTSLGISATLNAGEFVVVWCANATTTTGTYSVADTNLNTWAKCGSEGGDSHGYGVFFVSLITVGGSTTITGTRSTRTRCAAMLMAWRPEEQKRFTVVPAAVTGRPARTAALRAT